MGVHAERHTVHSIKCILAVCVLPNASAAVRLGKLKAFEVSPPHISWRSNPSLGCGKSEVGGRPAFKSFMRRVQSYSSEDAIDLQPHVDQRYSKSTPELPLKSAHFHKDRRGVVTHSYCKPKDEMGSATLWQCTGTSSKLKHSSLMESHQNLENEIGELEPGVDKN